LSAEQKAAVAARADEVQVSIATLIRFIIADVIGLTPGPVVRRALPPSDVLAIAHVRELVAELGGALVQAAVAARKDGRPVQHSDIEALIPQIKAAVYDLDALKEKSWRPQV
jgi:hypothetical protein